MNRRRAPSEARMSGHGWPRKRAEAGLEGAIGKIATVSQVQQGPNSLKY
ncbi:MAG: hypothetical protein MZV70_35030 [Desulfobacterales bacterium]|nr:hypothetical protein [Desulfobacterales bacterium]